MRDPSQKPTIAAVGKNQPGKLDILVSSIEDIKDQSQARSIIDSASPNYIVFSAGAGGKGGPDRTMAVDRDACIAFIQAAVATPSVTKFVLISYVGSRREKASWWSEAAWSATQEANNGVLKHYYPAKVAADEYLTALSSKRGAGFVGISLRPGNLNEEDGEGNVALGKIGAKGQVRRADVARVAMALLENEAMGSCWLDLLARDETVESAVDRCVREQTDCSEGENIEAMRKEWT